MKKILLSLVAVLFAASMSAQTEKLFNWGVEGGMNFNSLSFKSSDLESSNRAGFFIGPKVKVNVPILGLGVDGAILYSLNSANVKVGGHAASEELSYLEIPVNIRYSFGFRWISIYGATGPQFNYCLSKDKTLSNVFPGTEIERSTWGWNLGAGVEIAKHFQVGFTYTFPISSLSTSSILGGFGAKQKTAKIRLAYFF